MSGQCEECSAPFGMFASKKTCPKEEGGCGKTLCKKCLNFACMTVDEVLPDAPHNRLGGLMPRADQPQLTGDRSITALAAANNAPLPGEQAKAKGMKGKVSTFCKPCYKSVTPLAHTYLTSHTPSLCAAALVGPRAEQQPHPHSTLGWTSRRPKTSLARKRAKLLRSSTCTAPRAVGSW